MTVAPLVPPVPVADLGAAVDVLHAHGLRVTGARRLVIDALLAAERPVTADELAGTLGGRCDLTLAGLCPACMTTTGPGAPHHAHP